VAAAAGGHRPVAPPAIKTVPRLCVRRGAGGGGETLRAGLEARGIEGRPLHTSARLPLGDDGPHPEAVRRVDVERSGPVRRRGLPYISNLTGTWIRAEEATDPGLLGGAHPLRPCASRDGMAELLAGGPTGCSWKLGRATRLHHPLGAPSIRRARPRHAVPALAAPPRGRRTRDLAFLLGSLARLLGWPAPRSTWSGFPRPTPGGRRVPLPHLPLPAPALLGGGRARTFPVRRDAGKRPPRSRLLVLRPGVAADCAGVAIRLIRGGTTGPWLIFADGCGPWAARWCGVLEQQGRTAPPGDAGIELRPAPASATFTVDGLERHGLRGVWLAGSWDRLGLPPGFLCSISGA